MQLRLPGYYEGVSIASSVGFHSILSKNVCLKQLHTTIPTNQPAPLHYPEHARTVGLVITLTFKHLGTYNFAMQVLNIVVLP